MMEEPFLELNKKNNKRVNNMRCFYCRKEENNLNAKFCTGCGNSLIASVSDDNMTNRERQNIQDNHDKTEVIPVQKLNKKGTIITVSIFLFIMIIIVIIGLSGPQYDHTDHEILGMWRLEDDPNYIYYFTLENRIVGQVPTYRGKHTVYGINSINNSDEFLISWEINFRGYLIIEYERGLTARRGNSRFPHRPVECTYDSSAQGTSRARCNYDFTIRGNRLILENRHSRLDDRRVFVRVN